MEPQTVLWADFKSAITARGADWHYVENGAFYLVYLFDGNFKLKAVLPKDGGADQLDFEANYQSSANTVQLGQKVMADSHPVVIASNQPAVPVSIASMPSTPVTGTFWQATQPVSGTFFQVTQPVSIATMPSTPVTGTFWQTTQPVSGTVTSTVAAFTAVASASVTNVTASTTVVTLLASNASRKGVLLTNEGAVAMRIKYGTGASASDFTVKLLLNGYWEMPQPIYTGQITAIWDVLAIGAARVTEL